MKSEVTDWSLLSSPTAPDVPPVILSFTVNVPLLEPVGSVSIRKPLTVPFVVVSPASNPLAIQPYLP